ncbi:MAG: alpha-ribazole phosphatase family protein, partial [Betaproteobacteria bacterium]
MILHLVRHPPPEVGTGICYGRSDVAPTLVEAAATRLKSILPGDAPVFSSPLTRCRSLAERLHPAPTLDERLMEMHFGEWEMRPWDEVGIAGLDAWAADVAGYAPPGGESGAMVQARALQFLDSLTVAEAVLITHAGVMRALLAHWLALPASRWLELR